MLRLSRRFTTLLLWLAIALLPMRGWATAWMLPTAANQQGAAAVAIEQTAPPCHGSMGHEVGASTQAPSTCSMCDLCHSAAAQAPDAPTLPPALHDPVPIAAPAAPIEPRAPDGLYRPPRSLRA